MSLPVPNITSLETLLRSLIVSLPLLVLTVLFFLLTSRLRHRSRDTSTPEQPLPAPAQPSTKAAHPSAVTALHPAAQSAAEVAEAGTLHAAPPANAPGALDLALEPPPQTQASIIAAIEAEIARAQEAEATVEIAELFLSLGRAHMADGAEGEALSALRSAAGLAALHKAPKIHAHVRLELAEIAMNNGDPTTACEHWQMARMAFLDAGARIEGDNIDRRMRAQGCPTDWVLTDF